MKQGKLVLRTVALLVVGLTADVARTTPEAATPAAKWVPPQEESKRPSEADWAKAEPLALERSHRMCKAARIREWVRVQCKRSGRTGEPYLGLRVVGGSHEDVRVADPAEGEKGKRDIAVVFPVHRGDRRVIEIVGTQELGWKSFTVYEELELVVSETWLDGDPAPSITVH